jgi:hypothetical protein
MSWYLAPVRKYTGRSTLSEKQASTLQRFVDRRDGRLLRIDRLDLEDHSS